MAKTFNSGTSKSNVSRRIRVASFEAWGSVAICRVHSDTVFVSLVVSGSAALISTSAASHTYNSNKISRMFIAALSRSKQDLFKCLNHKLIH